MIHHNSFRKISREWLNEKSNEVKTSTLAAYRLCVENHLNPEFTDISDITNENIKKFIERKLENHLSEKSVRDIITVLKMIMRFAAKNGYLETKDIEIKTPRISEKKELKVFSNKNLMKLMDYLQSNINPKNFGILICISTGLRIGEICGLQWKDIDLEREVISINKTVYRIYNGKGYKKNSEIVVSSPKTLHSKRTVPISIALKNILTQLKPDMPSECFILTGTDKPMEPRTYRNYYKKVISILGLPPLKFHSLRHSFATMCIESECDYKTVSVILGHSNISTTLNLYVHPSQEQKKQCIEKMMKNLNSPC